MISRQGLIGIIVAALSCGNTSQAKWAERELARGRHRGKHRGRTKGAFGACRYFAPRKKFNPAGL